MKSTFPILIFVTIISLLTISCDALTGKEIARLPINKISTDSTHMFIKDTTLDLKKGDKIAIWSDMDIEYTGNVGLNFKMQILKDGENWGKATFDPTDKNITIGEVKTTLMDKTSWSFSGKNSGIEIEEDGKYTFKAILVASENPTLKVNKAEVVFKK